MLRIRWFTRQWHCETIVDYVGLSSIPAGATFDVVQPKENDTNRHACWSAPCGLISKPADLKS